MARLEELTKGAAVKGVLPDTLTYRDTAGKVDHELLYRDASRSLEVVEDDHLWSLDLGGADCPSSW